MVPIHEQLTVKDQSIVIYEQYTVKYDQTKQKTDRNRNRDENLNKETSTIIPNVISPRSHSPNRPHILYKVLVLENTLQQLHKNRHSHV